MAYAMTKQGSRDNVITYEFMCDTLADMNAIESEYRTLGSIAIVLQGESEALEVYICDSTRQWIVLNAGGSSNPETGGSLSIYVCAQNEVDNGLPDIAEPDENTIYLVPAGETSGNLYEEYIYVDENWEKFGAATIDLSGYATEAYVTSVLPGVATNTTAGIIKASSAFGVYVENEYLKLYPATSTDIKNGTDLFKPIVSGKEREAIFYGLAKAAGDSTQAVSANTVGIYTDDAKAAIRSMIGAGTGSVSDVQINGVSILNNGIANFPIAGDGVIGVVKLNTAYGLYQGDNILRILKASDSEVKAGTNSYKPIVPVNQDSAAFFGLAKAAGDTTQAASENVVGTYTADAKTAIQTMLGVSSSADLAALTNRVAELESEITSLRNALNLLNVPENAVRGADGTPVTDEALNYVEFDEPTT